MCNKLKFHHEIHREWRPDLRDLKQRDEKDEIAEIRQGVEWDILASSTEHLRSTFQFISLIYEKVKKRKLFRVLTGTSQPVHVAIMLVALIVAASLQSGGRGHSKSNNTLCKFIYTATTAAHFGSQIWMTFASGLALYFTLPRHHFGEVQKVLFPLYFTLTSIMSLVTLLAHLNLTKSLDKTLLLSSCFVVELLVRLYLCDPLVRLIAVKNEMEAKHGLGMEVGKLSKDSALFESGEYLTIHRRFRRLHTFIAFSNITCIGLSTAHLYLAVHEAGLNS